MQNQNNKFAIDFSFLLSSCDMFSIHIQIKWYILTFLSSHKILYEMCRE